MSGAVAVADVEAFLPRCLFPTPAAGPVVMAVSGGPDSMALMVLAHAAGLSGRAVHVDHGLRDGSAAEGAVVAPVADALGFGFESVRVHVGDGPDLEARARRARYGALPYGVLTGHTMDDQAETVLLNMLRGAALDGLSGMRPELAAPTGPAAQTRPAVRTDTSVHPAQPAGPVRRPLLGLRRAETVEICAISGIIPIEDPSNRDPRFRRNRVRTEAIPLINDIAGRDVVPVLARQAALLGADAALLDDLAARLDPTSAADLIRAPVPLARRAVRRWLRGDAGAAGAPGVEAHPPTLAEVERVLDVAAGHHTACEVSGGRRVARTGGRLRIVSATPMAAGGRSGGGKEPR